MIGNVGGFDFIDGGVRKYTGALSFVGNANAEAVGGHSDWVLPDAVTAQALRIVGGGGGFWTWTSSPYKGESDYARFVDFNDGYVYDSSINSDLHVSLVRSSQCLALGHAAHRKSLEQGQANMTALQAQPCPGPRSGLDQVAPTQVDGFCVIEHEICSFECAQDLVTQANAEAFGGHTDWMLPDLVTAQALRLVSGGREFSAWTSSPDADDTGAVWVVDFADGLVEVCLRYWNENHVCLVRESQRLALGEAGHRISLAEAGIVLDAEKARPLPDRPRGG